MIDNLCVSLINLEKRLLCDCMHNLEIPNQEEEPAPGEVESLEEEEGLLEDDALILLEGDAVCGNFLVQGKCLSSGCWNLLEDIVSGWNFLHWDYLGNPDDKS